jgi:hypothetical protein
MGGMPSCIRRSFLTERNAQNGRDVVNSGLVGEVDLFRLMNRITRAGNDFLFCVQKGSANGA